MSAGDEFYPDDIRPIPYDPLAYADFRRDEREAMSSCAGCGSPDPARIEGRRCSDCATFPKCAVHGCWLPCRACEVAA